MNLVDRVVVPLRILLVMLFAGLVFAQALSMPGQFAYMAREEPDLAYLRWPLTIWSILGLLCVQVVIVCTWQLLTMVKADRIFTEDAFVWVDAILWALSAAWVLLFAGFVYLGWLANDPGLPIVLFGMVLTGAVLVLLMVVMRALLRRATTLRADMEAVI
ncbi:DUF2975 domain-containing protein [Kribbella capetownensis]|uniref:DUF2975 domain-containing protein n=1 Tax=Kribbella capetownensis TaxID=1572659 RepID=A0A4R0JNH5_9ACTN|nr:DUF2975 domain-containing protein [Kribbella capetownensis]TCC48783.1 DUF2975 domain-containing protein [Kribbella capetownensis]